MVHSTQFTGEWKLDKPLSPEHREYLIAFSETRHVKYDEKEVAKLDDPLRKAVELPVGHEGSYFVGDGGEHCLDKNVPPGQCDDFRENEELIRTGQCQPGLWCNWAPSEEGDVIGWDCAEKFHNYLEWIKYLIKHFLEPWGYILNGSVEFDNEEGFGVICIVNNKYENKDEHIWRIEHLIKELLKSGDYVINGDIKWGNKDEVPGSISIVNNKISV